MHVYDGEKCDPVGRILELSDADGPTWPQFLGSNASIRRTGCCALQDTSPVASILRSRATADGELLRRVDARTCAMARPRFPWYGAWCRVRRLPSLWKPVRQRRQSTEVGRPGISIRGPRLFGGAPEQVAVGKSLCNRGSLASIVSRRVSRASCREARRRRVRWNRHPRRSLPMRTSRNRVCVRQVRREGIVPAP